MLYELTLASLFAAQALACAGHGNPAGHLETRSLAGRLLPRQFATAAVKDYGYAFTEDWGSIKPEYGLCQNGTQQSPIGLTGTIGLSQDALTFNYPASVSGSWFNTGFYPQYNLNQPTGGYGSLPTLRFGSETVFLTSFHIHNPSEHTVDGARARAELHLVHTNRLGEERAVVGIRLNPSATNSQFFASLPPYVKFDSAATVSNVPVNLQRLLTESGGFSQYFTYNGSLTSPPCSQNIRWILNRNVMNIGNTQLQALLTASHYSARALQPVWQHFS